MSHDLRDGLSLASDVNRQTTPISILDHNLNWDHHCSTATANGEGERKVRMIVDTCTV